MRVRKLQELFLSDFFFPFVTLSFLQLSLRVNLKINLMLHLQQPVSKEKQNPTNFNYYLILYMHMFTCIIYLRQVVLCPCS